MFNKINALASAFVLAASYGCTAQNAPQTTAIAAPIQSQPTTQAGDRYPTVNCVYPPEAMFGNGKGGTVLDITRAPFNARGDGKTDDTAAFVRAYDFVLREQDKVGYLGTAMLNTAKNIPNEEGYASDGPLKSTDSSFIIYIPNGEYLVSDTIIYSMPDRTPGQRRDEFLKGGEMQELSSGWERLIWIRFIGQNRDKTVIKLKDNAPGFGAGAQKAVVAYGKSSFNNRKALSALRNLTVDTGKGNVGAVAVDFTGANKAQINNVTLRSGDGSGDCGLLLKRPPVIGYHHDITIEGFDYGLASRIGHASAPVFEYVTLRNQNRAGILLREQAEGDRGSGQATLAVRKLRTEGRAPAAQLDVEGGHLVLLDSELVGADATQPAIDLKHGQLFASNVRASGYREAVAQNARAVAKAGDIGLFVSGQVVNLGAELSPFARMAVREAPTVDWPSGPDEWATPAQFGAKGDGATDDTKAVQAAFDAGKPFVFLTQANYKISAPIQVPAGVRAVDGMFRSNPDLTLVVNAPSQTPVRFSDLFKSDVRQTGKRPVVLDMAEATYRNTPGARGSVLYLLNGSYPTPARNKANIEVRAWSLNNEGKGLPVVCDGATSWVLGMKTERGPTLRVLNGANMEVYGASIGVKPGDPAILNDESRLIFVANSSAGEWNENQIAIQEIENGQQREIKVGALPLRQQGEELRMIPLYVGGAAKQ